MKKGLLVLFDNVEDSEALSTRTLLKRAGIDMTTVTKNPSKKIKTAYGLIVEVDEYFDKIDSSSYDFIVIPGGKYVSEIIDTENDLIDLIKKFNDNKRVIAAICAAPRFLGKADIMQDKTFTCYPGCEKDVKGLMYHPELKAVKSGHVITGRSAGSVIDFSYEIIKAISGIDAAKKILTEIVY